MKNLEQRKQKGISLIALIVTITVLSILITITINVFIGEDGIITKAENTKKIQEIEQIKSMIRIDVVNKRSKNENRITEDEIEEILSKYGTLNKNEDGTIKSLTPTDKEYEIPYEEIDNGKFTEKQAVVGVIVTQTNKKYVNNGVAVIPVGFAIVPGLDDVSEGLVISDKANDTENEGNQFVWIPVDKATFDTKFKITEGYYNGELDAMISDCGEADGTGVNSKIQEDSTVQQEAIAMYESVKINGGFYIGRYEAGTTATTGRGIRGETVTKKGANVYNYIGWSDSNVMTNVKGGAVEASRGMYKGKITENIERYGVVSTLCYGVQWDAALNFIDPNYITNEVDGKPNCSSDSYVVNSSEKGNYTNNAFEYIDASGKTVEKEINSKTLIPTGSTENTNIKNIYDLAGNVEEWVMESYSNNQRVFRGGDYEKTGDTIPVSVRYSYSQYYQNELIGFRVALYCIN